MLTTQLNFRKIRLNLLRTQRNNEAFENFLRIWLMKQKISDL